MGRGMVSRASILKSMKRSSRQVGFLYISMRALFSCACQGFLKIFYNLSSPVNSYNAGIGESRASHDSSRESLSSRSSLRWTLLSMII